MRNALTVLIDFTSAATQSQTGQLTSIDSLKDDEDGSETIGALDKALSLASRLTGNGGGSLGLHPAVYFYGPTGRHSGPLFMGTALLIGQKLRQNDKQFFAKFCRVRGRLEKILIESKDLIATLVQKHPSARRSQKYKELLGRLIEELLRNDATEAGTLRVLDNAIVELTNLSGTFRCDDDEGMVDVAEWLMQHGWRIAENASRFFPFDGGRPFIILI